MIIGSIILCLNCIMLPAADSMTNATIDTTKPAVKNTIRILSVKKENDTSAAQQSACGQWTLNKSSIQKILQRSIPIDGHRFHYAYDVSPCNYTGRLLYNGKPAQFRLNAGAFSFIILKDSSIILGYERADVLKYFISTPEWPE